MKLKRYAIIHLGEKTRWFVPSSVGGLDLVDEFERNCILDEEQADAFLARPGVDPRYEKRVVTIDVRMPPRMIK